MKKLLVLSCLASLLFSCSTENHFHDGKYKATIEVFGFNYAEINYSINGNEIVIDNSVTGISKLQCKQYKDRIEYTENNGTVRVLSALENGDIRFNDDISLKKIAD